jgi:AcrR family transcriptional regulator
VKTLALLCGSANAYGGRPTGLGSEVDFIPKLNQNTTNPSRFLFALRPSPVAMRRRPQISSRKQPKQARSTELVATILEAAVQVLAKEGAQRFTTSRVAEKAGVSVGSLYQYFPNKAAILFRLQSDEWRQTTDLLQDILKDDRRPPLERLRTLVHAFLRSECDEARMRVALNDAAPLYRDAPEAQKGRESGTRAVQHFMREVLPKASTATREMAGALITTTLSEVGKQFSETSRTPAEIKAYANAMADMFCAYITNLECR